MLITKSEIIQPTLKHEDVLIKEIGPKPIRFVGQRLKVIRGLHDEAKEKGTTWDVALVHVSALDADGDPVFSIDFWEVFQASNKAAWAEIEKVLSRINGWDKEETEKK